MNVIDGRTDRHRTTAQTALMHSIALQKPNKKYNQPENIF